MAQKKQDVKQEAPKKLTSNQQIKELEDQIANTKYNKATEKAIGLLKAKLAKLKDKQIQHAAKSSGKGTGYSVRKTGDGTAVLLGFPSVGKSTILNAITDAHSEVGAYEFTTLDVVPGILDYNHAKIQILDVPGIVHGAASGRGRGTEVLAVLRSADLVIMIIDATRPQHYEALLSEIKDSGIRINQRRPDVRITKKPRGGVRIGSTIKLDISKETIEGVLREMRINNADIIIRSSVNVDTLIDVIEGNRVYIPAITIINKTDLVSNSELEKLKNKIHPDLCLDQNDKHGFEKLKNLIYEKLGLISVYCKEVGKKADVDVPLIMFRNSTIEDMCNKLHRDFVSKFKFAKVWGKSAKFPGQVQMLKHHLLDGDVVEIHLR